MSSLLRGAVLVVLAVVVAVPLAAHSASGVAPPSSRPGASVGRVTDTAGAVIRGAGVRVLNQPYLVRTRDDGSFRIDNLRPGSYSVRVTEFGFKSDSLTVTVRSGGTADVPIRLRPVTFELEVEHAARDHAARGGQEALRQQVEVPGALRLQAPVAGGNVSEVAAARVHVPRQYGATSQ